MMNWREIRTHEALKDWIAFINQLDWETKEPILAEMTAYLDSLKELKVLEAGELVPPVRQVRRRRIRNSRRV